ncbi:hypothetical protein TraAM80_03684 [Trypanosoma rangeli]|uniref:Uncharacterized protein n=1 Tax=Trypanosoma rangeli TaxID=5698 RepID=A0A3R7MRN0_TRYRA|nr:uncharacterized protein TraAM80_03684 [Trypanosoma rangeli]RNF07050.1 hypothetical protein TraAM80_03684 [Trypanosoma rangeli]|eukprot:RNF07050.1 hypothetical protein TraAM80_03684 [Trypanosoma rangeli]
MLDHEGQAKALLPPGLKRQQRDHVMTGLYAVDNAAASFPMNGIYASMEMTLSEKLTAWVQSLGKPLRCTSCRLRIKMTEKTVVYRLISKYHVGDASERQFAFIFPVSGCSGALTSLLARINKSVVLGQLVRAENGASGQLLRVVAATGTPDETSTDKPHTRNVATYSITPNASDVLDGKAAEVGAEIIVETQWISKEMASCSPHMLQISYSFVCAPRLPDEIVCRTAFSYPLKMVSSPNCRIGGGTLSWKLRRRSCKIWLTPQNAAKMLRRDDKVFILTFYFQNTLHAEYKPGPLGPVFLVIFLFLILWMMLTKDLSV